MTNQPQANWQESFVATNLLPLAYNAWCGFIVCKGWQEFHLDPTTFEDMQLFQVDLTTSVLPPIPTP